MSRKYYFTLYSQASRNNFFSDFSRGERVWALQAGTAAEASTRATGTTERRMSHAATI